MRPDERKVHRAIARAHLQTGLPIFTHTPHESCPSCAMDQMDVIESVGVDPAHVVIGHMATLKPEHNPLATHRAIANRGAFIGLDTLGHEMGRSDIPATDKVRMVTDLLDAGLEDHILLSSDQGNVRQFKHYYGHGWSSVLMQFVPKLRYARVPEETLRKILSTTLEGSLRFNRRLSYDRLVYEIPRKSVQSSIRRMLHHSDKREV
ncbi:MAG: hypothetical protein CM1200mP25_1690 [Acidobacteriota bacterium]|nr:MAG: hypothetical protein CM1200mP25_1690 [Acidobacteriota bacterium]